MVNTRIITLSGTEYSVRRSIKKCIIQNAKVEELNHFSTGVQEDGTIYSSAVLRITPYTPDELKDMEVYGDPQHEDYLMSDDYVSDSRNEQWEWLKNEAG